MRYVKFAGAVMLATVMGTCCMAQVDNRQQEPGIAERKMTRHKKTAATEIAVNVREQVAPIAPTMWGVFFEDINLGADGGIYAEMVKNRSFEFPKPFMGWKVVRQQPIEGDMELVNRPDNVNNPRYLRLKVSSSEAGSFGLINEGFRGMGVKKDLRYDFSVLYRVISGNVVLHVGLRDSLGNVLGENKLILPASNDQWQKGSVSFESAKRELKAQFFVWATGSGVVDIDMVSLFPADTWKNRPGGLRADMVQLLADMKPGFLRFPGGCIVEGYDLSQRYQWKNTVGPVEDRPLLINRWNFEFAHRPTPDYFQTFGLGFFEYFQLAEDIGASPLPILNCGMACQFNTGELVPVENLDPYIQDALDLIEFANGEVSTTWGKVRARMGHPAPFNLRMMGVGNENWGPQYIERLKVFTQAIKAKYPEITLVNSGGTDPSGERFDYLNQTLREMKADVIDEHYYRRPEWFLSNARRYDSYPRNGSKVFAGEYAAQSDKMVSTDNQNNWLTAMSEAAFMTGLERNSAVVQMAAYAPLFAHADGWQWRPDLIWVNNLDIFGTTDYYVQQLFSTNRGNYTVPISMAGEVMAGGDSLYATAAIDSEHQELIIKIVNTGATPQQKTFRLNGLAKANSSGTVQLLSNPEVSVQNSFDQPKRISPQTATVAVRNRQLPYTIAPYAFAVIRVKL
ncbi:alpha-L-arabinofuranosidase C-terminal domain-containing protein [Flavihumibacter petaseus]|uniref:non-reducing end alpha-L-arabinofuranosidase n=1 Tax=Flavihumibacter petaseus NBRC 106054 TaxID=1220578 RepID=A0A0E9N262_9BACT|nr:alpha-L-arabinofuranosidase C-terminal domain-containing protein [Flavihumibacter petaseus]GAO43868.1 putative alpha-L-arabinofuranosidase [Flavihumibacter petaseus NBRC 106054]